MKTCIPNYETPTVAENSAPGPSGKSIECRGARKLSC